VFSLRNYRVKAFTARVAIGCEFAVWGLGAWGLGQASTGILTWLGVTIFITVSAMLVLGFIYFRRHEADFEAQAELALPGPLRPHRPSDLRLSLTR
jgi:uncharacterized sodium:solute symporter family permease YidK